jgi:hypothetical protein
MRASEFIAAYKPFVLDCTFDSDGDNESSNLDD